MQEPLKQSPMFYVVCSARKAPTFPAARKMPILPRRVCWPIPTDLDPRQPHLTAERKAQFDQVYDLKPIEAAIA
jgi:hypothetical protein